MIIHKGEYRKMPAKPVMARQPNQARLAKLNEQGPNRVYWAPIALESASWELALKPSLYNNRPIHSKYFRAGNTRLPRTSNLARGNTNFPRTWCLARGKHPHSTHLSLAQVNTHVNHRVSGASLQAGLASGNSLHDVWCFPCGLRTILSYVPS